MIFFRCSSKNLEYVPPDQLRKHWRKALFGSVLKLAPSNRVGELG